MSTTKLDSLYVSSQIQAQSYVNLHRSGFRLSELDSYPVDLQSLRIWDAFQTLLGTAGTDDLGITAGVFGTGCPNVTAGDVKTTSGTRYARTFIQLPMEYAQGESVTIACWAGMVTTVASGSATLDIEVYKAGLNALKTGSDLYAGAAISLNSTTFAELSFSLTATALNPADWLDVRFAITWVDAATATAVIPTIAAIELQVDTKG